ncbi:unnamed protein product [Closterium sp. Naga37s-1]|nr:unnamed protein product [Closterium sp. Naga37s-1]
MLLFSFRYGQGDCQTGEKQSPINIVMDEAKEESAPEKFVLDYDSAATTATVVNHGYTVRARALVFGARSQRKLTAHSFPQSPSLPISSSLAQVHVHSFSEHAVNGLFAAMEAHFVHQHENDNTSLAVVGVMIRLQRHDEKSDWIDSKVPAGVDTNTTIDSKVPAAVDTNTTIDAGKANWQSKVPAGVDTNTTIDVPQNFWTEMIDPSMGFWRYSGSLTTPACSEIVEWHVLRKAKFLSVAQAITFMNLIAKENTERTDNRLPEPLNGRMVTYFTNVSA